ncbi:TerB family tellurite resistance protein [Haliangium sp.]|uniref:tellurite resistance TerB family protein n=1 Tax=Haliangium sp. TaxID=2663208 RepID=UPI003D0C20F4
MTTPAQRLPLEIIKLLLQVAWADDRIDDREVEQIWSVARSAGLDDEDGDRVRSWLARETPLPPPDLGFLRAHKDAALEAAQRMILLDNDIARGELLVLDQIRELLGVTR